MIISAWLKQAQAQLKLVGISTARLDCLVLLEDATYKDRGWLLAHPEYTLQDQAVTKLDAQIIRRSKHVPLAYIRGKAEFYGHELMVNAHTLVPRPETESMIDMLKYISKLESNIMSWEDGGRKYSRRPRKHPGAPQQTSSLVRAGEGYTVVWEKPVRQRAKTKTPKFETERLSPDDRSLHCVDVGTGSGAIAIAAKLELPEAAVSAIDIDEKCLETARQNAERLGASIEFLRGNLLSPFKNRGSEIDNLILLCNLPYVPDNFQINTAATHEPRHALFGGDDGLDLYRELFRQVNGLAVRPFYILTESLPPQHEVLAAIAKAAGYSLSKTDDFIQVFQPVEDR